MRCWYTRWQLSNALDRGELASRMERGHAARCAACQAFCRQLAALDDRLSRGAHAAVVPVIAAPRRWLLPIAAPIAVAAAAVVAIAVTGVTPVEPVADAPVASPPGTLIRVQRVADSVTRLLASTPLENELDNLIADGKRGLQAVLALGGLN